MRQLAALLLLISLLSCFPQAAAPERANERWLRLESEHFELSTDLAPEDAKTAAETLERTRAALLAAAWNRAVDRGATMRTPVVVFREKLDFDHLRAQTFRRRLRDARAATIFLWGAPERWEQRTTTEGQATTSMLRHELVHRLAAGIYGRQPRWFSEGLAQFLETMTISEDGTTATVGAVNLVALQDYRHARAAGVKDVLEWTAAIDDDRAVTWSLYGVSWLLVHYLYNTHPDAFAELQTKLAQGVEPARAWSESFPTLTPAELDQQINHYSRFGKFAEVVRPIPKVAVTPVAKPITAADVLAIRAQLAFTAAGIRNDDAMKKEARQELDRALALEPGNPLALRLAWTDQNAVAADAVPRLRTQVTQRPDDGEAWLLLGATLSKDAAADREAALRRAVVLMPRNAVALNNLAWELVTTQRAEAALPFAAKARLLAPWDPEIIDTHAATLYALGRCPDALSAQRRAVDLLGEHSSPSYVAQYTGTLATYEKACGEPAREP